MPDFRTYNMSSYIYLNTSNKSNFIRDERKITVPTSGRMQDTTLAHQN